MDKSRKGFTKERLDYNFHAGPLSVSFKRVESGKNSITYKNNKHRPTTEYPSKYVIELAVFVDHALYDIYKRTFPRNTKESATSIVLAMIDMVSH